MPLITKTLTFMLSLGLLALAAPLAHAVAGGSALPPITIQLPGAAGPARDRLLAEQARLKKLEQVAYARNPDLKRVEGAYLTLRARLRQEQDKTRKAIDTALQKQNLSRADLDRFKLNEITDLLMKILPAEVVDYPELKAIIPATIRQGPPPFPAQFEKQFPGKRPAEVPSDELLAFYKAQLKAEAARAGQALQEVVKGGQTPDFMLQSMQLLTRMKCVLIVYREYLKAMTPPELTRQRALVASLEKQAGPQGTGIQGITVPPAKGK